MIISGRGRFKGGGAGGTRSSARLFFAITWFLCNDFDELQTMLFEVELIIDNAPVTYVDPNTIETFLTPNYLLFCIQLL